ncbi:MAG: hypothetical protein MHPSP_002808 [Paramarteilia canceri]
MGINLSSKQIKSLSESKPMEIENVLFLVKKTIEEIAKSAKKPDEFKSIKDLPEAKKHAETHFCPKCGDLVEKTKFEEASAENIRLKELIAKLEERICSFVSSRASDKENSLSE